MRGRGLLHLDVDESIADEHRVRPRSRRGPATLPATFGSVSDVAAAVVDHDGADLLSLTETLCRVPSVFPDEGPLADAIEARLRARAATMQIDRVANNVIARTQLGRDRRIVLGGHLDTVPPNGNALPTYEGDTLHGLGTADMKSGLAVMLRLAEQLGVEQSRFDV